MKNFTLFATAASMALASGTTAQAAATLYAQGWNGTANMWASQNDPGGNGNFATVYDNFNLATTSQVTGVTFVGGFFNPPNAGNITGFSLKVYADNAGQPGAAVYSTSVAGNGGETGCASVAGFPVCSYSIATNFVATAGTSYWLSVVPDLNFPPQWGWAQGTGGDGGSYQDFLGGRGKLNADLAFSLTGTAGVPEPSAWAMMLAGFGLLGLALRRREQVSVRFA